MKKTRKSLIFIAILFLVLVVSACKSEFEKIRSSGDPEILYKEALRYYGEEEYQKAQTLLELIISSYRGKKEGEDIYFKYAYTYYYLENYILATYYFKNFAQTYAVSPLREEADFMSAYSNYQLSPIFRLDQEYTLKAIEEFEAFVNLYPDSKRAEECNRLIDELRAKLEKKALESGKLYFNLRQYQAAINSFENLLKDFPETNNVEEIRYLIYRSSYLLAENSILEKRKERYEEALEHIQEFLRRFPKSTFKKELEDARTQITAKIKLLKDV